MNKTCLLGGIFNCDMIYTAEYPNGFVVGKRNTRINKLVQKCVGGTCGNVSTILPYLGVQTFPIVHLDTSDYGKDIKKDLEFYGADVRFVRNSPEGGTSIFDCKHCLDEKTGQRKMTHNLYSPTSSNHPKYKTIVKKEVTGILSQMEVVPDIFFFDWNLPAFHDIATELRQKGTLVYFEPENYNPNDPKVVRAFHRGIAVSDIVKFSGEKISVLDFCDTYDDKLFIMTLGEKGLQYKWGDGEWIHLNAPTIDKVVDWEGAGDWLTSKTIALLCEKDLLDKSKWNDEVIGEVLTEASQTAAQSVTFMTPKGMIDAERGARPKEDISDDQIPTHGIIGAICGDIIGSHYEGKTASTKKTNFKMFPAGSCITDDTTMTLAIAKWLQGDRTMDNLEKFMVEFFPMCNPRRYGHLFREWYHTENRKPYGAMSNGSAMRVSAVAWAANSLDECLELAKQTADISHNSPEGEAGAMSVAAAVYMARTGKSKAEIKQFIEERFGYDLNRKMDDIRKTYVFTTKAAESVPEAIICYLEASSYEEAVRLAVSLGGDADTQAAIAGAIAAATPGMEVPQEIAVKATGYMTETLKKTLVEFEEYLGKGRN